MNIEQYMQVIIFGIFLQNILALSLIHINHDMCSNARDFHPSIADTVLDASARLYTCHKFNLHDSKNIAKPLDAW